MRKGTFKPLAKKVSEQNKEQIRDLFMDTKNGYVYCKRLMTFYMKKEEAIFNYVCGTIQAFGSCIRNDSKMARLVSCDSETATKRLRVLVDQMQILKLTTPMDDDVELIEVDLEAFKNLDDLLYYVTDEGAVKLREVLKNASLKQDHTKKLRLINEKYLRKHESGAPKT